MTIPPSGGCALESWNQPEYNRAKTVSLVKELVMCLMRFVEHPQQGIYHHDAMVIVQPNNRCPAPLLFDRLIIDFPPPHPAHQNRPRARARKVGLEYRSVGVLRQVRIAPSVRGVGGAEWAKAIGSRP